MSNFIKSYQNIKEREYRDRVLPRDMKDAFALLQENITNSKALAAAEKPELTKPKSIDELLDDMDINAQKYRERYHITANPEYDERVSAFKKPVTKEDLARFERYEKQKAEWSLR